VKDTISDIFIRLINIQLKKFDIDDLRDILILLENTTEIRDKYAELIKSGKFVTDEQLKQQLIDKHKT
jgi:hypothetical protein